MENIFLDHGCAKTEEFETLCQTQYFKLERIVSHGMASPDEFWYEQDQDEWVCLLQGLATIQFVGHEINMQAGDFILLPAKLKHRVSATSQDAIWLALHFAAPHN